MDTLYLTNTLRSELKKPIGKTILGSEQAVKEKFVALLKTMTYKKLIAVGDVTSKLFDADIKIFDSRILRNIYAPTPPPTMTAKNPPASIDKNIWETLEKSLESPEKEKILIDGEEDLLVLPLLCLAGDDVIIVYGLPHEGICYVVPDRKTKATAESVLNRMRSRKFKKITVGGTFDHLHDGHRYLLAMSKYYAENTLIGITSPEMAKKKPYSQGMQPYDKRKKAVENYSKKINLSCNITKINDFLGPAAEDEELDSIILTEETFENGKMINQKRKENNLKELEYIVLPYILGPDKKRIESIHSRIK